MPAQHNTPAAKFSPDHQTLTVQSRIETRELVCLIRNHNPEKVIFKGNANAEQREVLNQARNRGIQIH